MFGWLRPRRDPPVTLTVGDPALPPIPEGIGSMPAALQAQEVERYAGELAQAMAASADPVALGAELQAQAMQNGWQMAIDMCHPAQRAQVEAMARRAGWRPPA